MISFWTTLSVNNNDHDVVMLCNNVLQLKEKEGASVCTGPWVHVPVCTLCTAPVLLTWYCSTIELCIRTRQSATTATSSSGSVVPAREIMMFVSFLVVNFQLSIIYFVWNLQPFYCRIQPTDHRSLNLKGYCSSTLDFLLSHSSMRTAPGKK